MNIKYATLFISGLLFCFFLVSCKDNNDTYVDNTVSNDAQIYSFSMVVPTPAGKDSLDNIYLDSLYKEVNKHKYAIDQKLGVIYNPDSLPYGTLLDTVAITLTFASSGVQKVTVTTPDSIQGYIWNQTDSINLSKRPIKFTTVAYSGVQKEYTLDVRIHQVDPDTIVWNKEVSLPEIGSTKVLLTTTGQSNKQQFYTFIAKQNQVLLYTSDAKSPLSWTKQSTTNLPQNTDISSIIQFNGTFYCIDDLGAAYSSVNGIAWTKVQNSKKIISILGILPTNTTGKDLLLVTVNENGGNYFAKGETLASLETIQEISGYVLSNTVPNDFPLRGAAATTNVSSNKSLNMLMLVGGTSPSPSKTALSYTWLIKNTSSGIEIAPFLKKAPFVGGAGISSFLYNDLFYVLDTNKFYTSSNWGEVWQRAPRKQDLNSSATIRSGETLIVDTENNIWIFGGISKTGTYLNDVWKGRLNSLNP